MLSTFNVKCDPMTHVSNRKCKLIQEAEAAFRNTCDTLEPIFRRQIGKQTFESKLYVITSKTIEFLNFQADCERNSGEIVPASYQNLRSSTDQEVAMP